MADPITAALKTGEDLVKKPASWFKGSKLVFILFVLFVIVIAIRFRSQIAALIFKVPYVGPWVVGKLDSAAGGAA